MGDGTTYAGLKKGSGLDLLYIG